jgi:hypothetical protein
VALGIPPAVAATAAMNAPTPARRRRTGLGTTEAVTDVISARALG